MLTDYDCFEDFLALYCKIDGRPDILIKDLNSDDVQALNLAEDVGEISPMVNDNYRSQKLDFLFSSPFVYQKQYCYEHKTKKTVLTKETKLMGSPQIVRNEFDCKQFMVPANDGTEIPLNIYFKKDLFKLNRRNRVVLEGYGAYGIPLK